MQSVNLTATKMRDGSTKLQLKAPFHPNCSAAARPAGGRWSPGDRAWFFDPRDVDRVRALCLDLWGIDPLADTPPVLHTLRVDLARLLAIMTPQSPTTSNNAELRLLGRLLVERRGAGAVWLGDGVVLTAGEFALTGGTGRTAVIGPVDGIVLEVRDMPAPLVEKARAQYPDAVTIVVPPDPALVIHEVVARATRIEAADPDGRPADESPMAVARRALAALTPEQRMRLLTENL